MKKQEEEEQERKPSFTITHVILLSILITALSLNKVKEIGKNSLENSKKLSQIERQFLRNLNFDTDTDNVCKKADEKLQKYYQTGDASLIGLNNSTRKQSTATYIKALTDIVASQAGRRRLEGGETSENEKDSGSSNITENLKTYLMHLIPVLAFFVIAILSIPGWIVCCSCCCCNCCCCCCCKRPICRFPFFIVTMAFNAIVFIVCIYGLASSNKVFVGFANVECALMKFIKEVTDGETRQETPRWPGFQPIKNKLGQIVGKVNDIEAESKNELNGAQQTIDGKTKAFDTERTDFIGFVHNTSVYRDEISGEKYWLSTYAFCGKENDNKKDTFIYNFKQEYTTILGNANTYITGTINNFNDVFDSKSIINSTVQTAQDSIDSIQQPVDSIKNMVADAIVDYSDKIDKNGKLGFKLIYSVLTIIVAANAALVVVYFVFGTTSCLKCKTLRCLNKLFIHIFWNISALLMIVTFIVGAILTLVGTLGNDLVSVVSYFISADNLNAANPSLIGSEPAKYLKTCLIGNGDLSTVLNFSTSSGTQNITQLQTLQIQINQVIIQFNQVKDSKVIQKYKDNIDKNKIGQDGDVIKIMICPFNNDQDSYLNGCQKDNLNSEQQYIIENGETNLTSLSSMLDQLREKYSDLMKEEISILTIFNNTIRNLTSLFDDFIGTNGSSIFSFLNCKFIGNNLDIILKYLKEALGKNIYNVGVFLLVAGCSMVFSIIFTILEVIIINAAVDDKLKSGISGVSKFV